MRNRQHLALAGGNQAGQTEREEGPHPARTELTAPASRPQDILEWADTVWARMDETDRQLLAMLRRMRG